MKIEEYYNLDKLRNINAELVFERVGRLLDERSDICQCEQCVLDLTAYVLNSIPPSYGTSLIGPFDANQTKLDRTKAAIEVALREAIEKVTQHPNH
jgi:competence protein ComFB